MASARFFEHNNFGGRSVLIDNPGSRYQVITFDFLNGLNFNDIISSIQLRSSTPDIPSSAIIFQDARFSGNFKAFNYNSDRDITALPDFNDQTSSILLMNHVNSARSMIQLRFLAGNQLNSAIDGQLSGDNRASRDGDVLAKFTIDLFEVSDFGVDLILLETPIKVHTPWPFSDYSAKIRYWIKLFINDSHQCRGFVAAWGYWIEGGILTGSIEGRLRPEIQNRIGTVETMLNNMLTELDFHQWTDVYLMPGRAAVDSDYDGNLDDDCTIVLPFVEQPG